MKVNAERISETFESARQEMLRLDETSFLSTGGQLRSETGNLNEVLSVPEAPVKAPHFHPFHEKYLMLENNVREARIHKLSLYRVKPLAESDAKRGLGFEGSAKEQEKSDFHPFGRKYRINSEIIKKIF